MTKRFSYFCTLKVERGSRKEDMTTAADRRRIPGPPSSYPAQPISSHITPTHDEASIPQRERPPLEPRRICKSLLFGDPELIAVLRTSLITTAPGSAYIETSSPSTRLVVSVHGPGPLPGYIPYTPPARFTVT